MIISNTNSSSWKLNDGNTAVSSVVASVTNTFASGLAGTLTVAVVVAKGDFAVVATGGASHTLAVVDRPVLHSLPLARLPAVDAAVLALPVLLANALPI